MKNRIELKLKFPAKGLKKLFGRNKKVGFRFTEFALFEAFDILGCEPSDIDKFEEEERLKAIFYGAAVYDCIKTGRPVFFTYDKFKKALESATVEEYKLLGKTWANASYPQWIRENLYEEEDSNLKKKSQSKKF